MGPRVLLVLALLLPPAGGVGLYPWGDCVPGPGVPGPPPQPAAGPGGRDYPHGGYREELLAPAGRPFWLLEPQDPQPAEAPVVVLLHGLTAQAPSLFRGWLEHLARKGQVVVFPLYQVGAAGPSAYGGNAAAAVRDALAALAGDGRVRPDPGGIALAGHSLGGTLAADLAARAADEGLPPPRVVFPVEPGGANLTGLADLSRIPGAALLVSLAGDEDGIVGQAPAARILHQASAVPAERKDFVLARSDRHGCPQLVADHSAPLSGTALPGGEAAQALVNRDALDYFGWWKLLDALVACAFRGSDCGAALGGGPAMRGMGAWSDGAPVRELWVTDDP